MITIIGPDNPTCGVQVENVGRSRKSRKPWVDDRTTRAQQNEWCESHWLECEWYEQKIVEVL